MLIEVGWSKPGWGLARDFAIAQRVEKPLVVGQRDADAEADPGQAAAPRLVLDGGNQSLGETEAAGLGPDREAAEIEVAVQQADHGAAHHLAVPLGDDGAGIAAQFGSNALGGLAESAGFRDQPAAVLGEGGGDGRGDGGCVGDGRGAQDKSIAHVLFLA